MYLYEICIKDKPVKITRNGYIYDWDGGHLRTGGELVQFYVNLTTMDNLWEIVKPTLESICKEYGYKHIPFTNYDAVYIPTNNDTDVYTDPDFSTEKLKKLLEVIKNG